MIDAAIEGLYGILHWKAFGLMLWLIGFFVAIPVMVFSYLLRHRESWTITIVMPTVAGGATWGLFNNLLHLPFPPGKVFELLGWGY